MILSAENEGPDQTAQMRKLIRAFAARIYPKTRYHTGRPIYSVAYWKRLSLLLQSHL